MKKFKLLALLLAIVMFATLGLTACGGGKDDGDKHTCDFTGVEWSKDATHHWHVCKDADCSKTDTKVAHTYDATTGLCVCGAVDPDFVAECEHEWVDASCTQPKHCSKCNEEEGYPTNHAYENGECVYCHAPTYTYNQYASSFPNCWNPHAYETSDEGDMMSYFVSSFFEFDYKLDDDNKIVDGEFIVYPSMAADFPVDVTADYAGQYDIPEDATESYAYKITLRDDLVWNDGTPIKAEDFIYSMKEQLNPLFLHYRADSYYNSSTVLAGAEAYVMQGSIAAGQAVGDLRGETTVEDWLATNGTTNAWINWDYSFGYGFVFMPESEVFGGWGRMVDVTDPDTGEVTGQREAWNYTTCEDKKVATGATLNDVYYLFKNVGVLFGRAADFFFQYFDAEVYAEYLFPEYSWDNVGIKAVEGDELSFYFIMSKPFPISESNFEWAYDFGSSWLVKKDLYEAQKQAPSVEGDLWTSNYGTTVMTTVSFGPYMLDTFQLDTEYALVKNNNWFGYKLAENEGRYQTTHIHCRYITSWDTAWSMFQKGELDAIGMDVKIAGDYKGSSRAYFNPRDYVSTMQIQSSVTLLKTAEDALNEAAPGKYDKQLLSIVELRKALSLAYDRVDFNAKTTTASQVGFGLFGPAHYYDAANGKVYRNEDIAKQVICEVYAVNVDDYDSLDEAYDAVTGYDLTEARRLVGIAVEKGVAAGYITLDTNNKVNEILYMVWGSSVDSESARRPYDYIKLAWEAMLVGTALEGKLEVDFNGDAGDDFARWFQSGKYDILMAGWSGAAWNPFYLIMAYLDDSYKYAIDYNENEEIEVTVPGFDFDAETEGVQDTHTMQIIEWYQAINGLHAIKISDTQQKLVVLAALEKDVLEEYVSVPTAYSYIAALRGYKIEAHTDKYHTFMGWGGIKYFRYNYTDNAWTAWVAAQETDGQEGVINYKI